MGLCAAGLGDQAALVPIMAEQALARGTPNYNPRTPAPPRWSRALYQQVFA